MRIGIDARAAVKTTDGIGRYAIELLNAYSQRDDLNQYIIFKNPQLDYSFELDSRFREINVPLKRYSLKEQLLMPGILERENLDIFHSLHFTLPLNYKGLKVMTVHDIMPILFPWFFGTSGIMGQAASIYLSVLVKISLYQAAMVIVDSNNTARDIQNHYKINMQRLCRIYLGIDHLKHALLDHEATLKPILGFSDPFLLTVTNFRPYKNTKRLLEAFKIVRQKIPTLKLIVVGDNPKYFKRTLGRLGESEKENVEFLGFVDDTILTALMTSAEAFLFPSLYEGFGFPILEAMALGAPVITSSSASLPEIGGTAVIYINPNDIQDIASAIVTVCTNKELQTNLRTRGEAKSREFRWHETAAQTLTVYDTIMKRSIGSKK